MSIDIKELQKLATAGEKLEQIRTKIEQRKELQDQIAVIDNEIDMILSGDTDKPVMGSRMLRFKPNEKSKGYAIYLTLLDSNKPLTPSQIAEETGVNEAGVRQILGRYTCFKSEGWGKGYTAIELSSG